MIATSELPDYLPARMLNEFVYCPRLFFYEWVEGQFAHNVETLEGAVRHRRVDGGRGELAPAEELAASGETLHARSVQLSSERYRLIAKLDLIEATGEVVTPVDYKRGAPRTHPESGTLVAWDADRVQVAVQALILRENGYRVDEAVLYYAQTKQRVRVVVDDSLVAETLDYLARARAVATERIIPPPLADSPKCPRCSLVGICLPDETRWESRGGGRGGGEWRQRTLFDIPPAMTASADPRGMGEEDVRRLVAARDDLRPLYLNTPGYTVGKSGQVLRVKERERVVQEVRLGEICQLNLYGNIQLTTQAIQALCEQEIPIAYFSQGGWFYGITQGLGVKNIFLRREQFRLGEVAGYCLRLARAVVAGKIRNQRTLLQRNHVEPPAYPLALLRQFAEDAERMESLEELLGIEGSAARVYFEHFSGMLKSQSDEVLGESEGGEAGKSDILRLDFTQRNRRPPRDPVNALLSLAYSLLAKDLTIVTQTVGFDPYLGFYHQPRFGRPSLALDLMEPFRPLIAESAVLTAINTRMVTSRDFVRASGAVALTAEGRKSFFRAYEQRMDTLVTHPLFGYRVSYRRLLEIQTRLLARVYTGEVAHYPVFVTR
ncbi:MAG: CRISPR-associated endonuclease Cas1 [Pirellulales bacterium]